MRARGGGVPGRDSATRQAIAVTLARQGKTEQARREFPAVLEARREFRAVLEARREFRAVLEAKTRVLGADHPSTRATASWIE